MNWMLFLFLLIGGSVQHQVSCQNKKNYQLVTIAFYNLENLFDFEDDPLTFDDDRTPLGKDHWTEQNYRDKLQNMAEIIVQIGSDATQQAPALLGVCEVENRRVLEDLLNVPELQKENYDIVHYESPDLRGVDVALLYKREWFKPTHSMAYELKLFDSETSERIHTRDQLLVSGLLHGEPIHLIVNHWPSRRGGDVKSDYKRVKAAKLNKQIADSLFSLNPYSKIISMGDFNDDPIDKGFKEVLGTKGRKEEVELKGWYNPMENMHKIGLGSLAYDDTWNLFDQILLTREWLSDDFSEFRYYKAGIFNTRLLQQKSGKYKGYPFKSYADGAFTGGYSDHFPVYVYLIKEVGDD